MNFLSAPYLSLGSSKRAFVDCEINRFSAEYYVDVYMLMLFVM